VLVNNVARLQKCLNLKFEKNENSFANSMHMLLAKSNLCQQHYKAVGKKALRQQRSSPVGEGLLPLPTANSEVVGEADGVGTVWPRRCFANSFSFPTAFLLGKNPFANSRTLPSVLGF
jgi:hypothetical protein